MDVSCSKCMIDPILPQPLTILLSLFRPYIKLDLSGVQLYPLNICSFCANEISVLAGTLRDSYGLRRVPLRVLSLLLAASTIHLLNLPDDESAMRLNQAFQDFQAMSTNHQWAARCITIVQSFAIRWRIALPEAMFNSHIQHQPAPPSSSVFWSASIPQERSFSSESSASNYSPQDSGLLQPPAYQHRPVSPSFLAGPSVPVEQFPVPDAIWTPFPNQTMPFPHQSIVPSLSIEPAPLDALDGNWSLVDQSEQMLGSPSSNIPRTEGFTRWQWP